MEAYKVFMLNLKYRRLLKNYTQRYMAETLHLSRSSYSKWESGICEPKVSMLTAITKALDVTIDQLFDESITEQMVSDLEKKVFKAARTPEVVCDTTYESPFFKN